MSIFIYGTLRYEPLFTLVSGGGFGPAVPAVLPGMAVEVAPDGPWPAIVSDAVPRADGGACGILLTGLSAAQTRRLDDYERPFGYLRSEVTVRTDDGRAVATTCYLPPAGQPSTGRDWSLDDWIAQEARVTMLAAAEVDWAAGVDDADLRRQWPMIRMRAAASLRAAGTDRPATLRLAPAPDDWSVRPRGPMTGEFFRLAPMLVTHRRFDGGQHSDLPREVLVGADAALVLPYDARRDRILLVEQFRAGPARRGDPNPWTLEPVAGIVDADETPREAALREAQEEAALDAVDLRHMFSVYASPGNATDHFHCYLGLADLPDDHATRGGLEAEAEDLRLHLVGFDRAMALLDAGEVTAGPLAAMLLWLFRARPALRAGQPDSAWTRPPDGAPAGHT